MCTKLYDEALEEIEVSLEEEKWRDKISDYYKKATKKTGIYKKKSQRLQRISIIPGTSVVKYVEIFFLDRSLVLLNRPGSCATETIF